MVASSYASLIDLLRLLPHIEVMPAQHSQAPLQSISIPRYESRNSAPSPPYIVYAVLVALPVRTWTVYRRYNDFLNLHNNLTNNGALPSPAPFPSKHPVGHAMKVVKGLGGLGSLFGASSGGQDEALLKERKEALERYLRAILTSTTNSTWRESEAFKEFIELPTSQSTGQAFGLNNQGSSSSSASATAAAYRQAHLPGAYNDRSAFQTTATTRQLGRPPQAVETEATRTQDDASLFSSQQAQFDRQDATLNDLTAILRRQRQMGTAINQELVEQNEILDDMNGDVERVQGKMTRNEKQIRKLG